jgi:hypothetical protein
MQNNVIMNDFGGGLYLNDDTEYCLIEGNYFLRTGESIAYPKEAIQLSGNHITIRKNIFHTPFNVPLSVASQPTGAGGPVRLAHHNYIYNNTASECRDVLMRIHQTSGVVQYNVFTNNLLYYPVNEDYGPNPWRTFWIAPGSSGWGIGNATSDWGYNTWLNNCMYPGRSDPQSAVSVEGIGEYQVSTLNASYPAHFSGNIQVDPQMFSANIETLTTNAASPLYRVGIAPWSGNLGGTHGIGEPDTCYGDWGWYKIKAASPCRDAGVAVSDPNGSYVRGTNANWGWSNLTYQGSAPDIGAYEYVVAAGCTVYITAPTYWDNWVSGTSQDITWTHTGTGNVKIVLWRAASGQHLISASTPNDGTYSWTVTDAGGGTSSQYRIKITDLDGADSTSCFDFSDTFTLTVPSACTYQVTAPAYGNNWTEGTSHSIQWQSVSAGANVKLELYKAASLQYVIDTTDPNDGAYTWTVNDSAGGTGTDYRIKVSDVADPTCYDFSDYFTITATCSVTVWLEGTEHAILWDHAGGAAYVKLDLYKGGALSYNIAASTMDDGSYLWRVDDCNGGAAGDYQIRVADVTTPTCYGYSPYFTITPITHRKCRCGSRPH